MHLKAKIESLGYGEKIVIKELELEAEQGEVIALLGPNGAGKTTILKSISGLLKPQKGVIYIDGLELYSISRRQRSKLASYMPPSLSLGIETTTVFDFLLSARIPYSRALDLFPSKRDLEIIETVSLHLDLYDLLPRKLVSLSSGELQRVLLGFSLAKEASIILADEPTAFLDLHYKVEVLKLLRKMAKEMNKLVVIATHELMLAPKYVDKVVLIDNGRIIAYGETKNIISKKDLIKTVFKTDIEIKIVNGRIIVSV